MLSPYARAVTDDDVKRRGGREGCVEVGKGIGFCREYPTEIAF